MLVIHPSHVQRSSLVGRVQRIDIAAAACNRDVLPSICKGENPCLGSCVEMSLTFDFPEWHVDVKLADDAHLQVSKSDVASWVHDLEVTETWATVTVMVLPTTSTDDVHA